MPLNINSVGSSGVGGSETSSKSLIYQGIIEEHATGGSVYKFQDDFICSYDGTKIMINFGIACIILIETGAL